MRIVSLLFCVAFVDILEASKTSCSSDSDPAPLKLQNDIFCDYDNTIRARKKTKNSTELHVKLVLKTIDFDHFSNTLTINNWLSLIWIDSRLTWNPKNYDGIESITIKSSQVWLPDFTVFNLENQGDVTNTVEFVQCVLYNIGSIHCVPASSHSGLCIGDLTKYPYDIQTCQVIYGSWLHSGETISYVLNDDPVTISDYTHEGVWELLNATANLDEDRLSCCPNASHPSIIYTFTIRRLSTTIAATYVVPAIVMILLTLTTLCLDPEHMDRLMLACCNILFHLLYHCNLAWQLPDAGKNPPLLIIYSRDSLLLCIFSLVLTVTIRRLIKNSKTSPLWLTTTVSTILSTRPGQVLFLFENNPMSAASFRSEEDGATIIESSSETSKRNNDWVMFAKIIDKLCFVAYFITYLCMFVAFIP